MAGIRAQARRLDAGRAIALIVIDVGRDSHLLQTLDSIAGQVVPPAEVVIVVVDDARAQWVGVHARTALRGTTVLRLITRSVDEPEADACNRAIAVLQAQMFGWVAAGDLLSSVAIANLQFAAAEFPLAKVIYTDEDWLDDSGRYCCPRLKTGWDPDAQMGLDLLGRLCVMDTDSVRSAGGLRAKFGTAVFYDLHCRVALGCVESEVRHVPAVLYHRHIPGSGLARDDPSPSLDAYLAAAREAACEAAASWIGRPAAVLPVPECSFVHRVEWPLPQPSPLVSILVPTRDRADLLENCVAGLLERTDYPALELVILDNDSVEVATQDLFRRLTRDRRVRILHVPGPFNYSDINNRGAEAASGEILVLMNNDVEVLGSRWLHDVVAQASRPDIGCVGVKLLYGDRRIQHAGVLLQKGPLAMHAFRLREASDLGEDGQLMGLRSYLAVTAACLTVRRSVFEAVHGFDAHNLQIAYSDIDLCLRVADAGYRNVCVPFTPLLHLESASRGLNVSPESTERDRRELATASIRWLDKFERDPYVNPQLWYSWDSDPRFSAEPEALLRIARAR